MGHRTEHPLLSRSLLLFQKTIVTAHHTNRKLRRLANRRIPTPIPLKIITRPTPNVNAAAF